MSKVVNVKVVNLRKDGFWDLLEWLKDKSHVYIGRHVHHVIGADKSEWANPFSVKSYGRAHSLELYKEKVKNSPEMMLKLKELKGKTLGCWCYPERCHGNVLSDLIIEEEDRAKKILEKEEKIKKKTTLNRADKILLKK